MPSEQYIQGITALDIEKYHRGLLTPGEMNALEKAALDDPFLADALEGYSQPGVQVAADRLELQQRLQQRLDDKKIIPLAPAGRRIPWLRAAAMVILIGAAAFITYRFAFNNASSHDIARTEPPHTTPAGGAAMPSVADQQSENDSGHIPAEQNTVLHKAAAPATQQPDHQETLSAIPADNARETARLPRASVAPAPVIADTMLVQQYPRQQNAKEAEKKHNVESTNNNVAYDSRSQQDLRLQNRVFASNGRNNNNAGALQNNIYRGQVIDANNNPLPFANITNADDNVGTYSDARGNFVLTSPDSVLHVQVRSLGFQNATVALERNAASNEVVMREDQSLPSIVVGRKRVNSSRARTSSMVLQESEPLDGWENYDTYLANNVNIPEMDIPERKKIEGSGEVEVSFEVNRYGEPTNIKVERSLCEKCDQEAIRLVKEGPKWKRKKQKGRTSVTISF